MLHAAMLAMSVVALDDSSRGGAAWENHGVVVCLRVSPATLDGKGSSDRPEADDLFGGAAGDGPGAQPAQWARTLAEAGVRTLLLHARTDEGFCLWPSALAEHSTRQAVWRGGSGDLVAECAERAAEHGIGFGLSLSADGVDPAMWTGLIGELGGRMKARPLFARIESEESEPDAARIEALRRAFPGTPIAASADGDFRSLTEAEGIGEDARWTPREVSVPIRPNFFWRQSESEHVRNLARLESLWYETAGRGALLLLHVPIDGDGRIAEPDARRLREFHQLLASTFRTNLLRGAGVVAEAGLDPAASDLAAVIDGDSSTGVAIPAASVPAEYRIALERPLAMNHIVLIEHGLALGRIASCSVEVETDGGDREAVGTTGGIGPRRVLRFGTRAVRAIRITVQTVPGDEPASLAEIQAFAAPPVVTIDGPVGAWSEPVAITLRSDDPTAVIRYTLDGRTPSESDPIYTEPLRPQGTTRIRAAAWRGTERSTRVAERTFVRNDATNFRSALQFIVAPKPGLRMRRFRGGFITVRAMDALEPLEDRVVERLGLPKDHPPDQFGLIFEGFIEAPHDGVYTFTLRSDDGSVLELHNELLIDRDGAASWEWHQGRIALAAGWHPIRLAYYDISGEERLQVRWSGPGIEESPIPSQRLAH